MDLVSTPIYEPDWWFDKSVPAESRTEEEEPVRYERHRDREQVEITK